MPRPDRDKLLKKTKAEIVDEIESLVDENDKEHMKRLRLQSKSVMSLMGGRSYEEELEAKDQRIAELETALEQAREELRRVQGASVTPYNIRVL